MDLHFDINLTSTQQEIWDKINDPKTRILVAVVSRQAGKTIAAETVIISYLCRQKTVNAYISPTFTLGKKVYGEIVSLLQPTGLLAKTNSSDLTIETTTGSVLRFFSMQSINSMRGQTITGVLVWDEAAFAPNQLPDGSSPYWNVIYATTKARRPKQLVISTPNGKQGQFYDFYLRAKSGEQGYQLVEADIYRDELISKEDIEELRKNYPPIAFAQEFEIQFLDSALTVFPGFEKRFTIDHWSKRSRCWLGIDPSTVGEDRTILTAVNDELEVMQEEVTGTLDQKYDRIASIVNELKPVHTYVEGNSIGMPMFNEIRKRLNSKATISTITTTNSNKKDMIDRIAVMINNGDISFEKDNKLLYQELGVFTFKLTKAGNVTYAAQDGYHDDTVTSLMIALECREKNKVLYQDRYQFSIGGNSGIR